MRLFPATVRQRLVIAVTVGALGVGVASSPLAQADVKHLRHRQAQAHHSAQHAQADLDDSSRQAARAFAAGANKNWYSFSVNNVLLQPGDYWIGMFMSGAEQVLRNYGDGAANWYGNDDVYSDGATDPFGAGNTGTVTLSVRAGYTLE